VSIISLCLYSGRKTTDSLGNVTVRGEKDGKSKRGARLSTDCLSMYSITENIYCSQLSSVAILLPPEPNCFTPYNTRKGLGSLPLCAIVLRSPPPSHVSSSNGQRSSELFCVYCTILMLTKVKILPDPSSLTPTDAPVSITTNRNGVRSYP
jgi:hypothetical protein